MIGDEEPRFITTDISALEDKILKHDNSILILLNINNNTE